MTRLNAEGAIAVVARVVWPRPVRVTWVSATGNDANLCNRAASCQTLSGVLSKTAATGQINVRSYPLRARSSVRLRTLIAVCATFLIIVLPGTAYAQDPITALSQGKSLQQVQQIWKTEQAETKSAEGPTAKGSLEENQIYKSFAVSGELSPSPCDKASGVSPPTSSKPLSAAEECGLKPKDVFKECNDCPEMIVVPAGEFTMGSPDDEPDRNKNEGPQHNVTFASQFAVGRYAVTFDEWDACVAAGGCEGYNPSDQSWGRGRRPVIHVSWNDAQTYVAWLSHTTGKPYRLLTEAEREYVTRAGTATPFWFGATITLEQANFDGKHPYNNGPIGVGRAKTLPVNSFAPNPWGLYQVHGNVWDWVEDCFNESYVGAPSDGSAWMSGECDKHVLRGGAWIDQPRFLRSAFRLRDVTTRRYDLQGFRVARTLSP